jgi:hypothetical protein
VKVVVHRAKIAAMMSPAGSVGRATMRAAGRVRDRAKENVSVDTGLLRNSIVAELQEQGLYHIVWRVGTNLDYGLWQEVGTPPIFARRAPFLVFQVNGRWVRTYSTKGVPAQRYLTRAIQATSIQDFR